MPLGLVASEFLYQNTLRRYPLAPHAVPVDTTGSFTLPDDLLVELYLPISFALNTNPANFYISAITVYPTGLSLTVSYNAGNSLTYPVVTSIISFSSITEFTPFIVSGIAPFNATVGKIVYGRIANILQQPFGSFTFTPSATPLDVDCIRPQLQAVTGITIRTGIGELITMTGNVELVSGTNMALSFYDANAIRFDAIEGAGLNETCECTQNGTTAIPVTSINGVTADNTGAIQIVGDSCLTVTAIANGLQITDKCSSPCCGCTELEAITSELQNFSDVATTIQNFTNNLQGQVTQMTQVVLGSKLADNGCVTCT